MKLKLSKLFRSKLKRPSNVFDVNYIAYNLSDKEVRKIYALREDEQLQVCKSYVYKVEAYEILYRRRRTFFSIYRASSEDDARKTLDTIRENMLCITKNANVKSNKKIANLLSCVTKACIDNCGWSCAHIAAHLSLHQLFADEVADVIETVNNQSTDILERTPLHIAIETQHQQTIKAILNLKPDLTLVDKDKNTLLHMAAKTTVEIYALLWSTCNSNQNLLNARNNQGCTPIHMACYAKKPNIVRFMLRNGLTAPQMTVLPPRCRQRRSENDQVHQFTADMVMDFDDEEMQYGGSPLHWVRARRTLDKLFALNLQTHAPNFLYEKPAHVLTRRHRFKCLIGLLSHDYTVTKASNFKRETPLHYAVKHSDISAVQALIVFDADVNAKDKLGQSARHLATIHPSQFNNMIIHVLHAVGAKRCDATLKGCAEGCSYNGEFNGTPYERWPSHDDQSLYKKMLNEQIIQEARRKKQQNDKDNLNERKKTTRMLSLDGGGVRGLVTAIILIELGRMLKYPLYNYFEWLIGTSTGGVIATLLSLRLSPQEIRKLYFVFKDRILAGRRPYSSEVFDNILKQFVGENTVMSDIKSPRKLIITGTLADRIPPQLHLFRSYQSAAEICNLHISSKFKPLPNCHQQYLWAACRASGSAPTYFRCHGPFLDGGIIANNPTLDGLTEIALYNQALRTTEQYDKMEELETVISIGTGKPPVRQRAEPLDIMTLGWTFNFLKTYKSLLIAKEVLSLLMDEATSTDRHVVDRAMAWCHGIGVPHFRISPQLSKEIPLNSTDDVEVVNTLWETKAYMYAMRNQLHALVELLELSTPPDEKDRKYSNPRKNDKKISELAAKTQTETEKSKCRDDVRDMLKETKNKVKMLIQIGVKTKTKEKQSDAKTLNFTASSTNQRNRIPPGPPASPSIDAPAMTKDDLRRDLATDVKLRDTTLIAAAN